MTDKEQIKDSLKNHSKNFNENSTQEKEQIIIDGVDVSGCGHLVDKEACGSMDCQSIECERNPNCYFKQLARKTKECEKMKYYLEKIRADELSFLDIDEDDYFANCNDTNYSNIITYVEYALGENEDE